MTSNSSVGIFEDGLDLAEGNGTAVASIDYGPDPYKRRAVRRRNEARARRGREETVTANHRLLKKLKHDGVPPQDRPSFLKPIPKPAPKDDAQSATEPASSNA